MLCNSALKREERLMTYCHLLAEIIVERFTTLASSVNRNNSNNNNNSNKHLQENSYTVIERLTDVLLNSYDAGVECVVAERLNNSNYAQLRNYLAKSVLPCVTSHLQDNIKRFSETTTCEMQRNGDNNCNTSYNDHSKHESIFAAPRSVHHHSTVAHSPKATKAKTNNSASSTIHSLQELTIVLKESPFSFFDHVDHVEFVYICTELDMTRPFVPSCIITGMSKKDTELAELISSNHVFHEFAMECVSHHLDEAEPSLTDNQSTVKSKRDGITNKHNIFSDKQCNTKTAVEQKSVEELETMCQSEIKCVLEVIVDTDARCKRESRFAALPSLPVFSLHDEDKMLQRIFTTARTQTGASAKDLFINVDEVVLKKHKEKESKEAKDKEGNTHQDNTLPPPLSSSLPTEYVESNCTIQNAGVFTMEEIVHFFKLQPHQAHKHLYECPRCHLSFLRRTGTTTLECLRCRYNAEFELLHHPFRSEHAQLYQWSYVAHLIDNFDVASSLYYIADMLVDHDEAITISEHDKRAKMESVMHIMVECANRNTCETYNAKIKEHNFTDTTTITNDRKNTDKVSTVKNTQTVNKKPTMLSKNESLSRVKEKCELDVVRECVEKGVRVFVEHLPKHLIDLIQLQSGAARRVSAIPRIISVNGKKQMQISDKQSCETLCKLLTVNAYVVWASRLRRHVKHNIAAHYKRYVLSDTLSEYNTVPLMFLIYALINATQVSGIEHARQLLTQTNVSNINYYLLLTISACLVKLIFVEKIVEHSTRNRQALEKEEQKESKESVSNSSSMLSISSQHSFVSSALLSLEQNDDREHVSKEDKDIKTRISNADDVSDYDAKYNDEYNWHNYFHQPPSHDSRQLDNVNIDNTLVESIGCANECLSENATIPVQIPLTLDNLHTMQRQQRREQKQLNEHKRARDEVYNTDTNHNIVHHKPWKGENVHYKQNTKEKRDMENEERSQSRFSHSSSLSSLSSRTLTSASLSYSSSYSYNASASSSYSHWSSRSNAHSRASSFSLRSYYADNNGTKNGHTKEKCRRHKKENKREEGNKSWEQSIAGSNNSEHVNRHGNMEKYAGASANGHLLNNNYSEEEQEKHQYELSEEHNAANCKSSRDKRVENILALYYIAFCEVFGTISVTHIKRYLTQMCSIRVAKDKPHSSYSFYSIHEMAFHLPTPASHLWMPHLQRCTQGGMTLV